MSTPTDEQLKAQPKTKVDTVSALGPGGEVYNIPLDVAREYVSDEEHPPLVALENLKADAADEAEVGGRHAVLLADGTIGYHADWAYGRYCWHVDGCWYTGWHRHPFGWTNYLAADSDG